MIAQLKPMWSYSSSLVNWIYSKIDMYFHFRFDIFYFFVTYITVICITIERFVLPICRVLIWPGNTAITVELDSVKVV